MKTITSILLTITGLVLAYFCYDSIMLPINFKKEMNTRQEAVIERLVAIKKTQEHFAKLNDNRYCSDLDSLISFANSARVVFLFKEGELTDKQIEDGMTEEEAVRKGLIIRDTTYVAFMDTVLNNISFPIDSLPFIPYSQGQKFELELGNVTTVSLIQVNVMEVRAPYIKYLQGMNAQMIDSKIDEAQKWKKYPGLKIGDLKKMNNNSGNWEW